MNPWSLLVYALVGAAEWALATRRAMALIAGRRWAVSGIVFVENILALVVFTYASQASNWLPAVAYSAGAAIGAWGAARR